MEVDPRTPTSVGAQDAELVRQLAAFEQVLAALAFYADHDSYFALAIIPDPPCGDFWEDFEEDHGHPDYDRPMPGKRARAALKAWFDATHPEHNDGSITERTDESTTTVPCAIEVVFPPYID